MMLTSSCSSTCSSSSIETALFFFFGAAFFLAAGLDAEAVSPAGPVELGCPVASGDACSGGDSRRSTPEEARDERSATSCHRRGREGCCSRVASSGSGAVGGSVASSRPTASSRAHPPVSRRAEATLTSCFEPSADFASWADVVDWEQMGWATGQSARSARAEIVQRRRAFSEGV